MGALSRSSRWLNHKMIRTLPLDSITVRTVNTYSGRNMFISGSRRLNHADTRAPYPQMEAPKSYVRFKLLGHRKEKLEYVVYCETLTLYSSKRAVTSDGIGPYLDVVIDDYQ